MVIRDIMTRTVVTAAPHTPVREVAEIMRERNVGGVVLCAEDGAPVGFITDRDVAVMRRRRRPRSAGERPPITPPRRW